MGRKRVLVCYGVDIDAIAGWLGSYKGEDSSSDISRGMVNYRFLSNDLSLIDLVRLLGWHCRGPTTSQALRKIQNHSLMVHPGTFPRTLSRRMRHGARCRPRDRSPRLLAREPHRYEHGTAERHTRQDIPPAHGFLRGQASAWDSGPMVGGQQRSYGTPTLVWH
jgi:hypothetical protein